MSVSRVPSGRPNASPPATATIVTGIGVAATTVARAMKTAKPQAPASAISSWSTRGVGRWTLTTSQSPARTTTARAALRTIDPHARRPRLRGGVSGFVVGTDRVYASGTSEGPGRVRVGKWGGVSGAEPAALRR